ncbi:MAG TPA: Rieske (2Fe-2S) protein [Rhizomicrobium sp.]|jgi:nitrite reductase/ring-hydroxylating ferredoxin subunit|nr:Rieske (2Fe-2S) protein [Rhizomicrobium sp.]
MLTPTGIHRNALPVDGRKIFRRDGKQILLIARGERIFAIANRCPHEGYPLSEGTLGPDCVLTCNWHNWKFDLESGAALYGRDPVRTYPTAICNGEICVDLADPPAEAQRTRAMQGLDAALADNDRQRMARETARLVRAGFDAREAIVYAFKARNVRLEDGMTHAHAAAADWLVLADRADSSEKKLTAILEPLGHIAWDTEGAGEFPYASGTTRWRGEAFLAAIEAEDEASAVACVRGALADDIPYAQLQPVFAEAALAHYADFGHCAIYVFKAEQLIDRLGKPVREPVLLSLTRMLARATREERLPEFRGYGRALEAWDNCGTDAPRPQAFVGQSVEGAMRRALVCSGALPRELYDALLGAAAFNLLHYDTTFDNESTNGIADNVGWLDFTHALTFANACRHLCKERPDLWPRVALQMALFVGRNRKYVESGQASDQWMVADPAAFVSAQQALLYDHGIVEPIIACHRLKVLFALEDELTAATGAPWAATMCAAVNRYLHTPMKRHHGLRTAAQALDFVSNES